MNVLHINAYDQAGGAEQVATDLLNNPYVSSSLLVGSKSSDDPRIIRLQPNTTDKFFSLLDKFSLRSPRKNTFKALFAITETWNGTFKKLSRLKAYQEADIIHLHNIHGNYFDLKALLQIAKTKKIVWTLHDMWALTGGEFYTFGNQNYRHGLAKTDINYLAPLAQPVIDRRQQLLELKRRIYAKISKQLIFVPVSDWLQSEMQGSYVLPPHYQAKRIYNGYDPGKFFDMNKRDWDRARVLFFNQGGESKASSLFREIAGQMENADLYLIGNSIPGVQAKSQNGFIRDRDELCKLYNDVDILVFPSKAESFGLMPLEAMACGVCVITSDATALPELVNDGVGYVFASGNQSDLHKQLRRAIQNLQFTRELGKQSAVWAKEKFTLALTYKAYLDLYTETLND